jgi:hypothetical protein
MDGWARPIARASARWLMPRRPHSAFTSSRMISLYVVGG